MWFSGMRASIAGLAVIYPLVLAFGSLFSAVSPGVNSANLLEGEASSYFARKSNVFNLYFVKIGWAWTVFAFALFALQRPSEGSKSGPASMRSRLQAFARLTGLTLWWIAVARWFFGPALMERSFRLTGGACELASSEIDRHRRIGSVEQLTEAACKQIGGTWRGGHDISGHVFLLVLSSAALILEARPFLAGASGQDEPQRRDDTGKSPIEQTDGRRGVWPPEVSILVAVVSLDFWMLLMTAVYYHTFFEKVKDWNASIRACFLR